MNYRLTIAACAVLSMSSMALADDVILTGKRTLAQDTVISGDTITFKADFASCDKRL